MIMIGTPIKKIASIGLLLFIATTSLAEEIDFKYRLLNPDYHGEGAAFGDLNQDGHQDLVSGPFWFEGPTFEVQQEYYSPNPKDPQKNGYTNDNFLVFTGDFNRDSWNDIFVVAFPGTAGHWYENPRGKAGHWKKHLALKGLGNESPTLHDLDGDGILELFCVSQGAFGYAEIDPDAPTKPWTFRLISESLKLGAYVHGLGLGDIDGDQRQDLLTKDGWFQQPTHLQTESPWIFHRYDLRPSRLLPFPGGAQIYAYDIDGDKDNDLIMGLAAHGYGLAWFEQKQSDGKRIFEQHLLLSEDGKPQGDLPPFSQLHAVELADMNGDGLKDIITGKCRFAHGPAGDPDPQGAPVLYWFELKRSEGKASFIPHLISRKAGVGRQIAIGNADQKGHLDIAIGNKAGTSLMTR
jgi:hypothetical protein